MTLQSTFVGILLLLSTMTSYFCFKHDIELVVDVTRVVGGLRNIWDSTGFSPPGPGQEAVDYLTSRELYLNLALIGSLPFNAIRHVRIHWLLELVKANLVGEHGQVEYYYDQLDELISRLRMFGLRPSFELMGNPGNVFTDFEMDKSKDLMWQTFVTDLVSHYKDKFGIEEIKQWRFELWNEPDSKQYNSLNLSTDGYLRYARASMQGLRVYGIKVSGPAGTFRDLSHHNKSWSLLELCSTSLVQNGSCDIDTITFHKKGEGDAGKVVSNTKEFYKTATTLHPSLKSMKFANNEADILSGWWREEKWRGDVYYAADVCQVIASLLKEAKDNSLPLSYISNDNGFINQPPAYFNQRTLLTRFEINTTADRHSQWIRKPVITATAFLGYLGTNQLQTFYRQKHFSSDQPRLSVIASSDQLQLSPGWSGAVLISHSSTLDNCSDTYLNLKLKLPPETEVRAVIYQIDNNMTNPRSVWEKYGKPTSPSPEVLEEMRANEGPYVLDSFSIKEEWTEHMIWNRCPSVTLLHLCYKSLQYPGKVSGLHTFNITYNEVLLLWQNAHTRCISSYEVYFCQGECLEGYYELITTRTVIMLSFQFKRNRGTGTEEGTRGKYKVRVRDYWNRFGEYSQVVNYPAV